MYTQPKLDIDPDLVLSTPISYHGQLAIQAAQKMTWTKSKRQTSHSVCYHLLMMIKQKNSKAILSTIGAPINLLSRVRKRELVVQYPLEF